MNVVMHHSGTCDECPAGAAYSLRIDETHIKLCLQCFETLFDEMNKELIKLQQRHMRVFGCHKCREMQPQLKPQCFEMFRQIGCQSKDALKWRRRKRKKK